MLLSGIAAMLITSPGASIAAMIQGSHDAVNLSMRLVALYAFWLGFLAIVEKTGLADKLARILRPVVRFLFPNSKKDTNKFITMNMSANILGLGNAATPTAIKAINSMDEGDTRASLNMIMLVVISATSLQLIPTTVIGLRATHGSANPADFLPAGTIATIVSTVVGILLVKLYGMFRGRRDAKKAKKTEKLPLQRN